MLLLNIIFVVYCIHHFAAASPFDTWIWLLVHNDAMHQSIRLPLHPLCPHIARTNGHRLTQMRCKGRLISWPCLSVPCFCSFHWTWRGRINCCAALLIVSEDSFFHVVTAKKACSMPSGCQCFGKGCGWHRRSFFPTWSFYIWSRHAPRAFSPAYNGSLPLSFSSQTVKKQCLTRRMKSWKSYVSGRHIRLVSECLGKKDSIC